MCIPGNQLLPWRVVAPSYHQSYRSGHIHISGFFIDKQSAVERMTAQASNEPNPIIVSGSDPQVSVLTPKIDRITELQDGVGKRLKTFEVFGLLIVMLTPQSICKTSSRRQVG